MLPSVGRAVVFVLGAGFGYLFANGGHLVSGRSAQRRADLELFSLLALAFAAPACWLLAYSSPAGDRWTLGSLAAWALWFAVAYLAVLVF